MNAMFVLAIQSEMLVQQEDNRFSPLKPHMILLTGAQRAVKVKEKQGQQPASAVQNNCRHSVTILN